MEDDGINRREVICVNHCILINYNEMVVEKF